MQSPELRLKPFVQLEQIFGAEQAIQFETAQLMQVPDRLNFPAGHLH